MRAYLHSLRKRPDGKLPITTYFGYGVGQVGGQILRDTPALLLLAYMTNYLGLDSALAALMIFIAKIYVIFADPVVGLISDRTETRWGRRRPFVLAGGLLAGFSFFFLFVDPGLESEFLLFVYLTVIYLILNTGYSMFSVPYLTMASEMSTDPDERTTIISFRNVALNVGLIIGAAVAPKLIELGSQTDDAYALMRLVLAGAIIVSTIWLFFGTAKAPRSIKSESTVPLMEQFRIAWQNKPFVTLISANILQYLSAGCSYAGMIYFLAVFVGVNPFEYLPILILIMVVASTIMMPVFVSLSARYGKMTLYVWCLVLFSFTTQVYFFSSSENLWPVWIGALVMGVFNTGFILMSYSVLTDTIAHDFSTTGVNREGVLSSVYSATEKASFAIGASMFGVILSLSGFIEGKNNVLPEQPDSAVAGIMIGFIVFPALLHLTSLLILRRYNLPKEKLAAASA